MEICNVKYILKPPKNIKSYMTSVLEHNFVSVLGHVVMCSSTVRATV